MINFIMKIESFDQQRLMYMTDEEIEHIYSTMYYEHEEIVE
jgi:hypothetical protein